MAHRSSRLVIYGAIASNGAIAICKFIAAAVTASSAMVSEGIHSVVDTADGLLLLLGTRLSRRPPDAGHPFGHGKELYFWSLIVAVIIFGVGGGMSMYEGIKHVIHPAQQKSPTWNYWVLGIAAVFEGVSWTIAARQFWRAKGPGQGVWRAIRTSKDPTVFTVLLEDTAALLGVAVAFAGVFLGHQLGMPRLDGAASVIIGLILGAVAVLLAFESRGLLVGESADPEMVERIRERVGSDAAVEAVGRPLTMHLGPRQILLNLAVRFRRGLSPMELEHAIDRLETEIRNIDPDICRIFLEADALRGGAGITASSEDAARPSDCRGAGDSASGNRSA